MFWLLNEGIPINDKCKWARNKDGNLFNFIFEFLVEKKIQENFMMSAGDENLENPDL